MRASDALAVTLSPRLLSSSSARSAWKDAGSAAIQERRSPSQVRLSDRVSPRKRAERRDKTVINSRDIGGSRTSA